MRTVKSYSKLGLTIYPQHPGPGIWELVANAKERILEIEASEAMKRSSIWDGSPKLVLKKKK
jgi:hypothetical protein